MNLTMNMNWLLQQWQWLTAAAVAGALLMLMLLGLRGTAKLRRAFNHDLARIFEQLDLVRLDHLQWRELAARFEAPPAVASEPQINPRQIAGPAPDNYAQAAELATRGLDAHEIAQRCEISPGEARVLIAIHGRSTP